MSGNATNERIAGFDWLRGWAILAVVVIHADDGVLHRNHYYFPTMTPEGAFYFALSACARFCVPGFLMISGFLAERRMAQTGESPAGRWKRYAFPLLVASLVYAPVYFAEQRLPRSSAGISTLLTAALTGQAYYHLWFLTWLLIYSLLHRWLRPLAASGVFWLVMAGFAALFVALPGHQEQFKINYMTATLAMGLPGIGYYLAGVWAERHAERLRQASPILIGGTIIAGLVISGVYGVLLRERSFYNLGAAALSVGVFLWALQTKSAPPAVLKRLGVLSLGIYLWHPLFLTAARFLEKRLVHSSSGAVSFGLMCLEIVVALVGGAALSMGLARIKPLRSLAQ